MDGGGGGGGSGRMTSEHFFFCCYKRSAIFFLGMCRANFFLYNNLFFGRGRGGGVKIGSICVSP